MTELEIKTLLTLHGIKFVNRSYGQHTTETISLSKLVEIVNHAINYNKEKSENATDKVEDAIPKKLTQAYVMQFAKDNGYNVEVQTPNSYTGKYNLFSNEKMPGVEEDYKTLQEVYDAICDYIAFE